MSNNKYKILLVEDEENIRRLLTALLESSGFHVVTAVTCAAAEVMFASYVPDLVILDLGLPDGDGMGFLGRVRAVSDAPVIILSARDGEQDKVAALDGGANDYVTKPFGSAELLARVRSALRSHRRGGDTGHRSRFVLDELTIDYDARRVWMQGVEVRLTQTEYNILAYLSAHCGKVLTYAAIIKAIWGYPDDGAVKKLQVNMANIRKKLGARPGESHYIMNELGVGYRMQNGS